MNFNQGDLRVRDPAVNAAKVPAQHKCSSRRENDRRAIDTISAARSEAVKP
jgi:hypothetical protein